MPKTKIPPAVTVFKEPEKKKRSTAGTGRPTLYEEAFLQRAYEFCLLGATNDELAYLLGVHKDTIGTWLVKREDFRDAVMCGREYADAKVVKSLYRRATGYSHPAVKHFYDKDTKTVVTAEYTEYYPPDTNAAIHWLTVRQRLRWRAGDSKLLEAPNQEDDGKPPVIVINPIKVQIVEMDGYAETPSKVDTRITIDG